MLSGPGVHHILYLQAACGPMAEDAPPAVLLETSSWVWSGGHPLPQTPPSTAAESRYSRNQLEKLEAAKAA